MPLEIETVGAGREQSNVKEFRMYACGPSDSIPPIAPATVGIIGSYVCVCVFF